MKIRAFSMSNPKISTRLLPGLAAIIICVGLALGMTSIYTASNQLKSQSRERGKVLASYLASGAQGALDEMDISGLRDITVQIKETGPDIAYVFITDRAGNILAQTTGNGFDIPADALKDGESRDFPADRTLRTEDGEIYDYSKPVTVNDQGLGVAHIGLHTGGTGAMLHRFGLWVLGLTVAVAAAALVLVSWYLSKFSNRIRKLTESANEVLKENLGPVNQQDKGDEIQELADAVHYMATTLESRVEQCEIAEKELFNQKEVLRTILDVTPDMVALQDENLVYQAANKAFCSYFRLDESDVIGRTDFEIFKENQADQNYHEDMQILKTGKPLSKEISVGQGDTTVWFHILKVPVYTEGKVSGLLLTARDISVVKQYQERLVQSQKMEDLGRLSGGIAHEINTPLGIILGYAQMLLEDVEPDSQMADDLRIIEKQTRICSNIVSDLLGFSRQSQTTRAEVDINESIQEVISLVEHTFGLNRVRILCEFDPNIPEIEGDKDKLKQVWLNLFNNAFDAVEQDGYIRITTKLCAHRRRVAITLTDTGTGIKQEILNKIFDPFFSTKPVGKGTGLGLSVTFGIIRDHGGRINVLSPAPKEYVQVMPDEGLDLGPGSVFLVELPLWQNELPEEECDDPGMTRPADEKETYPEAEYEQYNGGR
ncbi:MAG: ATP-binding protein [Desulfobacterales bacterium]